MSYPVILDNGQKRFWLPLVVLGLAALLPFEVYSAPEQSVPVQTAEQAPAAPTAPEALASGCGRCISPSGTQKSCHISGANAGKYSCPDPHSGGHSWCDSACQ
ncbi:MAG: hypothetical protein USCGTAYLOR_00297 [Chromatiales bacterium USCg_Taylor]|jgi:hypothetical protein|nr:MAG: hypothetical protein USCGTAYLOR_00297 [Chromatiales bacterium USCg_Taylor]